MSALGGYRPYHAQDCPARTEQSADVCTCGGLDDPLFERGDGPLMLMHLTLADKDLQESRRRVELAVAAIDRSMMDLARQKAKLLGYRKPVCSNTHHHPHGPAGNCLSLP